MSNLTRPRSHTPDDGGTIRFAFSSRNRWSARLRPELVSDGVVAGYIHDISPRHRSPATEPRIRRERGDRD
jgi:hypothetical protein